MKLITHKEIDKKKWDTAVSDSGYSYLYAYSWYLDIVHPGWQAIIADDYSTVFPVPSKKKSGISYVIKPRFTQQLGWFGKFNAAIEKNTLQLLEKNFRYIDFSIHSKITLSGKWKIKENSNYELGLNSSFAKLTDKFNENCKRNLKKSVKSGNNFCEDLPIEELIKLFRLTKGKELKEISADHYRIIKEIYNSGAGKKAASVSGIKNKDGKLISAVLFIHWKNRIYYLFSASDEEGKKSGAAFTVIEQCVKKYSGNKIILDFEGSDIAGLARFYSGFGAERKKYFTIKYNNLPFYLKWLKK